MQVAGEDQREADRERQEDDEGHICRREDVGLDAGAEQGMEQRGGIVAREQGAIEIGQLSVEEIPGPEQGDHALQVAVGHVGHVEGDEGGAGGEAPARGPALAPDAPHRRSRWREAARATRGAQHDVERHEQHHAEAHQGEVQRGDVIGVSQRQPDRVGRRAARRRR